MLALTEPTTQSRPQREILLAAYRPLKYLRTEQKKLLKTVWSLDQGLDGTRLACIFCKKVMDFPQITVHHRDGDETDNELPNLAPACWDDNRKESAMVKARRKAEASKQEREKLLTAQGRELADNASDELKLNAEYEDDYRRMVIRIIRNAGLEKDGWPSADIVKSGSLTRVYVNAAACEEVGANPKTGYPYLVKMTNPINGFIELNKHLSGVKILMFKKLEYYELSENEIMWLHPKTGQKAARGFAKADRQPQIPEPPTA